MSSRTALVGKCSVPEAPPACVKSGTGHVVALSSTMQTGLAAANLATRVIKACHSHGSQVSDH